MNPLMTFEVALTMLMNCPFFYEFAMFFLRCFSLGSLELVWASIGYQRENHILYVNAFLLDSFFNFGSFCRNYCFIEPNWEKSYNALWKRSFSQNCIIIINHLLLLSQFKYFWIIHKTTSILNLPLATTFYLNLPIYF